MNKTPFAPTYNNLYPSLHQNMTTAIHECLLQLRAFMIEKFTLQSISVPDPAASVEKLRKFNGFCSKGQLYNIVLRLITISQEIKAKCLSVRAQQLFSNVRQNLLVLYKSQLKASVDLCALFNCLYEVSETSHPAQRSSISSKQPSEHKTQNDDLVDHRAITKSEGQVRSRAKTACSMASQGSSSSNSVCKLARLI